MNRCDRCNRELKDPRASYGWRCAQILGVSQYLNEADDETWDALFVDGTNRAGDNLSKLNKLGQIGDANYEDYFKYQAAMEISLRKGDIKSAEDHYRLAAKALNGESGSDKADIALASVLSSSMGFYIDPSEEFTNVEEMRQALKGEWFRKRIEEKGYNQGVDSWGNGAYSYLVSEDNLADLNWYNVNDDMISELNRVLEKYEINTPERIRHFLAQCMVESGNGLYLREGEYVQRTQQEYENYYNTNTKYGYNYRGAGYIQTTWLYSYQAFATFMISETYPELELEWKSPANTDAKRLSNLYETAKNTAISKGYDIKEYTDIVNKGTDYVAEKFAWEIAGFWWKAGKANEIVDGLMSGNSNDVDKVTSVVNKYTNTDSYEKRRKMYEEVMKTIK